MNGTVGLQDGDCRFGGQIGGSSSVQKWFAVWVNGGLQNNSSVSTHSTTPFAHHKNFSPSEMQKRFLCLNLKP